MTSTVSCNSASWELNSWGQNACQVYAQLQGQCNPSFTISQVTDATAPPYTQPNNACGCNVVAYNLMAGCSWCQTAVPNRWWLTTNQWAGNCTGADYNPTGISSTVALSSINIPSWAYTPPTGTTWNPIRASSAATPNSYNTPNPGTNLNDSRRSGMYLNQAVVIISLWITLWVLVGISVCCSIVSCIAHCQRQTRRRALYAPMGAYYYAKAGGYVSRPYAPIANPRAFGSAAPLVHPSQFDAYAPAAPAEAHVEQPSYGPVRTSMARRSGLQFPRTEMFEHRPTLLSTAPVEAAVERPSSPDVRGAFESGVPKGGEAGGVEEEGPRRTRSISYTGPNPASFYGAYMTGVSPGNVEGAEELRGSVLPCKQDGEATEGASGSKDKERAP